MQIDDRAIPVDSLVVVVGANGYMASESVEKLLQAGYRVRGTVRDLERHNGWMYRLFDSKWPGKFELVQVPDFLADAAFDEAFKGAAGAIYTSMPVILDTDIENVWGTSKNGLINTLEAAARAGVQRYVLGSSSKAVITTNYTGSPVELTVDSYNYDSIKEVYSGPQEDSFARRVATFSSGRALAELTFWDWVKKENPPFVANCVVPDGQFGRILDVENMNVGDTSSSGQLKRALAGEWAGVPFSLAFISDVQDSARLLVAALAKTSIKNERIFSYYKNRTWNDLRQTIRQEFPDRPELVKGPDSEITGRDVSFAPKPIARAEEILRSIGQSGFASEESILRAFVASAYPVKQ
ncbi:NAD(P)-binding Rossmann-fold containing protein [Glarea lozoyensis ATCC 20868]|uniref:NAD(P)-binding Rossmann-fold containing protein n=2 Tax=Glarea lozoyensis TaxID=101852 RepID=S3D302_GLAL2|nr:NAD(P)-binding Rossmann-fold containing protein [Glarea lozoyensis ATCC 20868]EHK99823.1 putative Aldehyde reductase 2 [Glarea lozoyensis 74030]EPE32867.1 NAD(P)-binding Rossmann-fold containing protein [Glarea lozoyensis ATCC 20868]